MQSAKEMVAEKIPTMFSSDLTVFLNLQEPTRNSIGSVNQNISAEIELLKRIATLPPFLIFQLSEWLRDSIYQFIVHPHT